MSRYTEYGETHENLEQTIILLTESLKKLDGEKIKENNVIHNLSGLANRLAMLKSEGSLKNTIAEFLKEREATVKRKKVK